ncbi:MAG: hypothetical protein KAX77_00310 [Xanthomonadales bacterium]|nr:hypothetical protein [Xanthomonadales bacterium]
MNDSALSLEELGKRPPSAEALGQTLVIRELTVRDFYAAHVLASIAQHYPVGDAESAARHAFAFADAAIQERAR